jgi:hypothetical protein
VDLRRTKGNRDLKDSGLGRSVARTGEVGGIAEEPYGEEGKRYAICAPGLVVQNELGYLCNGISIVKSSISSRHRGGLTRRKIQVARLMLPKTPDKASFGVKSS